MNKRYERIEELRIDHDMTQKQVGEILGMTQQQYSYYETGDRKPPIEFIRKLCLLYHVSADYILELPKGLPWGR